MTDEEMRIAIAEACGWKDLENEDFSEYGVPCFMLMGSNNTGTRLMPPDYLNDLNAMHEAEKVFSAEQLTDYGIELSKVVPCGWDAQVHWGKLAHATARQRAEAFLKTKGILP